jgi:hypothetical protein
MLKFEPKGSKFEKSELKAPLRKTSKKFYHIKKN